MTNKIEILQNIAENMSNYGINLNLNGASDTKNTVNHFGNEQSEAEEITIKKMRKQAEYIANNLERLTKPYARVQEGSLVNLEANGCKINMYILGDGMKSVKVGSEKIMITSLENPLVKASIGQTTGSVVQYKGPNNKPIETIIKSVR